METGEIEQKICANGGSPLSLSELRPRVEQLLLDQWSIGRNVRMQDILEQLKKDRTVADLLRKHFTSNRPATIQQPVLIANGVEA
jgi:hypothetical protein